MSTGSTSCGSPCSSRMPSSCSPPAAGPATAAPALHCSVCSLGTHATINGNRMPAAKQPRPFRQPGVVAAHATTTTGSGLTSRMQPRWPLPYASRHAGVGIACAVARPCSLQGLKGQQCWLRKQQELLQLHSSAVRQQQCVYRRQRGAGMCACGSRRH